MERKKYIKPHVKAKGEREIKIGSETWFWRVGKSYVSILSPNGKRTNVIKDDPQIADITDADDMDSPSFYVTPDTVYHYIVRNRKEIA